VSINYTAFKPEFELTEKSRGSRLTGGHEGVGVRRGTPLSNGGCRCKNIFEI